MSILEDMSLYNFLQLKFNIDDYYAHLVTSIIIIFIIYLFLTISGEGNLLVSLIIVAIFLTIYLNKMEKDIKQRFTNNLETAIHRYLVLNQNNNKNKKEIISNKNNNNNKPSDSESESLEKNITNNDNNNEQSISKTVLDYNNNDNELQDILNEFSNKK